MKELLKLVAKALPRASSSHFFRRLYRSAEIPKIYFCHVPKSAGSSIATAIRDQVYIHDNLDVFDIKQSPSLRAAKVTNKSMMQARETILAYHLSIDSNFFGKGHCYCRPNLIKEFSKEWNFITVLRNPIDRWISEYVYNTYKQGQWTKNNLPLREYLESRKAVAGGQQLVRYFSNYSLDFQSPVESHIEEALENLSQFTLVGTMDNLDIWTNQLKTRFSLKIDLPNINKSPKNQVAEQIRSDAQTMRKIQNLCKHDLEIYDKFTQKHGNLYSNQKTAL